MLGNFRVYLVLLVTVPMTLHLPMKRLVSQWLSREKSERVAWRSSDVMPPREHRNLQWSRSDECCCVGGGVLLLLESPTAVCGELLPQSAAVCLHLRFGAASGSESRALLWAIVTTGSRGATRL